MELAEKLTRARERRGLSVHGAADQMGIGSGSLWNLEGSNGSLASPPDPSKLAVKTVLALVEGYYPDLTLKDFVPAARMQLVIRGKAAARALIKEAADQ